MKVVYTFKQVMKIDDLVVVSFGNAKIVAIGQITGDYEYQDSFEGIKNCQFRKVNWIYFDKVGFPLEKLLNNKKISQQTIYKLDKSFIKKDF